MKKDTHFFRSHYLVDLFAGCGGLSLGFEKANFKPIFVNELNQDALDTYLFNRYHTIDGERFANLPFLRCQDANELKKKRLDQLRADLSSISEIDFKYEKTINTSCGAGSTLDVIAGGPPCQGYSGIGYRRSYSVDRKEVPANRLYWRMAKIIRHLRPRIFLFENVPGILVAKWARDSNDVVWSKVKDEFRRIPGYEVRWSIIFSKDYGVPQNRPRIFLVGIRKDLIGYSDFLKPSEHYEDAIACGFLPKGQYRSYPHLSDLLGDLVDSEIAGILRENNYKPGILETTTYPHPATTEIQKKLRSPPPWDPNQTVTLTEQVYSKHKPNIVKKFDHMLNNDGEIPEKYRTNKFSQRTLKPHWKNQEPNFTVTSLPDDYVHYCQPRILTVREWARLQLFPDWYRFCGKRTTGGLRRAGNPLEGQFDREIPKYTQIGNAVPVDLAETIAKHFKTIIDNSIN